MKVAQRPAAVMAVGLIGALALSGCSKKTQTASAGSGASSGNAQVSVAFVPKLQGIPYFEAMNTGGQQAAKDLGLQWIYKGSTTADPGAQTDIVKSLIQQKVSSLFVAPNDPDSMAPVLGDAQAKGIKIGTSDTDAPNSARQVFVNQATAEGIGKELTDALAEKMGGKGTYAIVSCGQTAANLNSWIAVQKKYTAQKYPNMKIATVVYAGEDEAKAVSMAKDLMNANPSLTGPGGGVHQLGAGRGQGGARGEQDRQGVHGRPRHAPGDEALPHRRLLQRRDPLGRREARLPDGLGRQAAGRRQADGPGRDAEAEDPHRDRTCRTRRCCCWGRRCGSPRRTSTSSTTEPSPRSRAVPRCPAPRPGTEDR